MNKSFIPNNIAAVEIDGAKEAPERILAAIGPVNDEWESFVPPHELRFTVSTSEAIVANDEVDT